MPGTPVAEVPLSSSSPKKISQTLVRFPLSKLRIPGHLAVLARYHGTLRDPGRTLYVLPCFPVSPPPTGERTLAQGLSLHPSFLSGFPGGSEVMNPPATVGDTGGASSVPG